jgi:alpha-tubulin suppressor-like RCC1 family protein
VKIFSDENLNNKKILQISTGGSHSIILFSNGEIFSWGLNKFLIF